MKVVFDENFFDEIDHFHPNFDESLPNPSPAVVLGEQATMEKTTQRFQKNATTLADLNAEGLNVQTVNDPLTMYVGAASQHVLRMSFVLEQEAQNFDRQVITFWSHLMHRDVASPLFFLPLMLGGLGVGSAVQRHLLPHGVRGSRCLQLNLRTQIHFFVQHHCYVPNSLNSNRPSPNK